MEIINKFDEEEVSSFLSPMQSPGFLNVAAKS
jgi:hypothetical protein